MSLIGKLRANTWKILLLMISLLWLGFLALFILSVSSSAAGSEIVFIAGSVQLMVGLLFVGINYLVYFAVRNRPRVRKIVGRTLIILYVLGPVLITAINGIVSSRESGEYESKYGYFTYYEFDDHVDNCEVARLVEDNERDINDDSGAKRAYLKSGENKLVSELNMSMVLEEKGHIICE